MNFNSQRSGLSLLSLANIEDLTQESSSGSESVFITDIGTCPWDCRDILISVNPTDKIVLV